MSEDFLEEEDDFFVDEFPDAVEERITHRMVAAANLGDHLGSGDQKNLFLSEGLGRVDSLTINAHVSQDDRLGFIVVVAIGRRLSANASASQLGLEGAGRRAAQD